MAEDTLLCVATSDPPWSFSAATSVPRGSDRGISSVGEPRRTQYDAARMFLSHAFATLESRPGISDAQRSGVRAG